MEELRPEDLEELAQELEEESRAERAPTLQIDDLLRDLQAGTIDTRKVAA